MAIDPQMEKVISYIVETEKDIAQKQRGNGQRPWLDFHTVKRVGKFDFPGVHEIFQRNRSNDDYVSKRSKADTKAKDLQTAKLSGDYLAALERDHRMRLRSRIRTFVHAQVTMPDANGTADGVIRKNTIDWLGRILAEEGE